MHNIKKAEKKVKSEKKRAPLMDAQLSTMKKVRLTRKDEIQKN